MATEILMPALSPTMEEGTLSKWLKKEGDTVKSGDILAEIETDKATMEFEAVDEGVLGKILVAEGTAGVKVNTPIAVLLEEGESADAVPAAKAAPAAAPVAEAPAAATAPVAPPAPATPVAAGKRIFASPLARRIAAEKGLDLAALAGSGPHGRIVKADVEAAGAAPRAAAPAPAAAAAPAPAAPAVSASAVAKLYEGRAYEEVTLDGMRRTIAARLTEAKQTIPHFYLRRAARIDDLLAFRAELNRKLEGRGVKLSVNDFIIKACALALQAVPDANAVWAGDRILKMKASDVAVAVAIEGGLFTPVLFDAEATSLSKLSEQMKDLAKRARDRKLAPHEYQGGSFAISNLGMFGIENFDAVINPPHGAILAVGAGLRKPVVNDAGEIEVATMMSMTLSVDHRVIDGALGAQLLAAIVENLENPIAMLA
ncbi:Dihydrolipoyllysine-residue acetyltransferase component of pyruvate dehydrogenase complex [bioreactor metagenome]|uniref:dihydrolipoyllysine-residue acetyltransferase n=1 Tax=bioreactor metagenome TaxID=1076179 RepID=A0A644VSJ3_9ZZZZ